MIKNPIAYKSNYEFNDFTSLIAESMTLYKQRMNEHLEKHVLEMVYKIEVKFNNLRDNFKKAAQHRLQNGSDIQSKLLYLDLLKYFEHIGDNNLNIVQALRKHLLK